MSVCIHKPPRNIGKQSTCCELCTPCADKTLVCGDVQPPPPPPPAQGEELHLATIPPVGLVGTVIPGGGLDKELREGILLQNG